MVAFDSNILIYFLNADPKFGPKTKNLFSDIEQVGGICSTLAITETMHGNIQVIAQIAPLRSKKIMILSVSSEIAELAGRLKLAHGLKNVDAIHIATAIVGQADEFVTNDKKLLSKKIKGIKIRGL